MALDTFEDIPDFDEGGEGHTGEGGYTPFQFLSDRSDEAILAWLNEEFSFVYNESKDRLFSYRRIARRCLNQDPRNNSTIRHTHRDSNENLDKPTMRENFYLYYIDQKVAYMGRSPIKPTFVPKVENSQEDINQAETVSKLTKSRATQLKVETLMSEQDRLTFKYGTGITKLYWDDFAGPANETVIEEAQKIGITEVDGAPLSTWNAKAGDVCAKTVPPYFLFAERGKKKWECVDFVWEVEFVHIAELKAEYPHLKENITKEDMYWLDMDSKFFNDDNFVAKYYFYHKPTKFLPFGELVIYTYGTILERFTTKEEIKKHMPDGELPYVIQEDIKDENILWGFPFLINIEQGNNFHDLIQSGIARNVGVAQAPKLLVPEGTINFKQAHNRYGILQYTGDKKPEWLQHQYVNRGEFEIQDRIEKRMDKHAKIGALTSQNIPAGITAATALRLIDDKELQENSEDLRKRKERVQKFYWKLMQFQDKNYKDDEERLVAELGSDNTYLIETFKKPKYDIIHSIEIENVSALSSTRAGRVSDIIDLNAANQKDPTFGRKEIISLLGLGLEAAFVEETSYAVNTSRTLLEYLKKGKEVVPAEKTDDLFEMYGLFSRYVESISYKLKISSEAREKINDYIMGIEYLISEQAKLNPIFRAKLAEYPKYPMFYDAGALVMQVMGEAPAGGKPQGTQGAGLPSLNEKNIKATEAEV